MYNAHMDCDLSAPRATCRKLSVTVQLSDPGTYAGGDLQLGAVGQPGPELRGQGSIIVFPAFVEHRVTPMTSGQRYSLVAWLSGPCWR